MENLLRKHRREFERLRMLKKKKKLKSLKKHPQNVTQLEGTTKVVIATNTAGEIAHHPSQTSSNDSVHGMRRVPQPSGVPLHYSDAVVATQNPSNASEVTDANLYKAESNQVLALIF